MNFQMTFVKVRIQEGTLVPESGTWVNLVLVVPVKLKFVPDYFAF